ncbi:MAG: ferritin family protein [Planctomycetes bacterium]|nr:ferritin family protein [Planctomycetota bacterium]
MMAEETFNSKPECESSSHTQHLCYMVSQGFNLSDEAEYQALVTEPQFKCQKCGRLAKSEINLCKPVKYSLTQKDGCEELRGRVMKYKSVDELLDAAIMREIQAQELYMKMAFMVNNPWMRNVLEGFAQSEVQHQKKLEAVKAGKIRLGQEEFGNFVIEEALDDIKPNANMNYRELLAYSIKKEHCSHQFYNTMASIFSESELKDMFLKLAQEEANHKGQLEIEYDSMTS